MKKLTIMSLPAMALLFLWAALALAQSTGNLLIPYGMSAGMQVLNRAMEPRPAAAPTPAAPAGYGAPAAYGAAIGEWRLVCEQWNGNQWVLITVPSRQCVR